MLGGRNARRRRPADDAEKPFWISFADLMTALMVLFLVAMSVALSSVTKKLSERESAQKRRERDIELLLARFDSASMRFQGVTLNRARFVIDFGDRARFAFNSSSLSEEQERLLREFIPDILTIANDDLGKRILKRIVVEGFTDRTGTYLSNLNLSLLRSQRVLCALFAGASADEVALSDDQKQAIRALFLVGGYSFNAARGTPEESRRIEMRLEFLGENEARPSTVGLKDGNIGSCAIGAS